MGPRSRASTTPRQGSLTTSSGPRRARPTRGHTVQRCARTAASIAGHRPRLRARCRPRAFWRVSYNRPQPDTSMRRPVMRSAPRVVLVAAAVAASTLTAGRLSALDLKLKDVHVRRPSHCEREVDFSVKFQREASPFIGHVGGGPATVWSYRIVVYSTSPTVTPIETFDVPDHALGTTRSFRVRSNLLACHREVLIKVDDGNQQAETDEGNNTKLKSWAPTRGLESCFVA